MTNTDTLYIGSRARLTAEVVEARAALVHAEGVTLDGVRAKVCGLRHAFAVVRDARGHSTEWAWETVARIVATKGGAFTT